MTTTPDLDAIEKYLADPPRGWTLTLKYNCWKLLTLARNQQQRIKELENALLWCSGSPDFAPEGQARKGWERVCQPLLVEMVDDAEKRL